MELESPLEQATEIPGTYFFLRKKQGNDIQVAFF
ncbi:MAG: hypothetical protein KatS3mg032_0569 [Cyclobacteriaceae bacterium]|nr:MAG: hypothetical protein KatS3mg032_0569 [Cyclobacteriaceae bacterium]